MCVKNLEKRNELRDENLGVLEKKIFVKEKKNAREVRLNKNNQKDK